MIEPIAEGARILEAPGLTDRSPCVSCGVGEKDGRTLRHPEPARRIVLGFDSRAREWCLTRVEAGSLTSRQPHGCKRGPAERLRAKGGPVPLPEHPKRVVWWSPECRRP